MSSDEESASLRVAVCQTAPKMDVDANLECIARFASAAGARGARVCLFPEAAVYPIASSAAELEAVAASFEEHRNAISRIAEETRTAIVAGLFEPSEERGRVRNTVVAHDRENVDLGSYAKIHLFDALGTRESDRFVPGPPTPLAFDLESMRFGIITCYDLRFPELARHLIGQGADALLVPAAWSDGPFKEEHWSVLLRARAIENTAYVIAAGQCGDGYSGRSAIIDPFGAEVAAVAENEGFATGDLRRDRLEHVRGRLPVLEHRRFSVSS